MNTIGIDNILSSDLKERDLMRDLEGGRVAGELSMTSNKHKAKNAPATGLQR